MQDVPAQGAPQESVREGSTSSPLANSFLSHKPYPTSAPAPSTPPPAAKAPARRKVLSRIVLPLAIFVAGIAGIAWVTQYVPNRGADEQTVAPPGPLTTPIRFEDQLERGELRGVMALWEPNVPLDPKAAPYAAEFEVLKDRKDGGHYDFEFKNESSENAEVGLGEMNCRCSGAKACLLVGEDWDRYQQIKKIDPITRARKDDDNFPWRPLADKDGNGLSVPPGSRGLVRLSWEVRRPEIERATLTLKVWSGTAGKPSERLFTTLRVDISYVLPVNFTPERVDVGVLTAKGTSAPTGFVCWSATRDLKIAVHNTDPCFEFTARRLDDKECRKLTDTLRALNIPTRIRSACKVKVVVHEQKGDKQLDLGAFQRAAPLTIRDEDGSLLEVSLPTIRGYVQGEIKVGALDQSKIDLGNFKAQVGTEITTRVWSKPGTELEYQGFTPAGLNLNVKLKKLPKESDASWNVYEMKVTVPPDIQPGPLHEDSAVILRTRGPQGRVMRIPVIGTAGRG